MDERTGTLVINPERIRCPGCGGSVLPVWKTRHQKGATIRTRQCPECPCEVVTKEVILTFRDRPRPDMELSDAG